MDEPLRVGSYQLLRPIGAGARSRVWLAQDAAGAALAVKTVDPGDAVACARLQHEAAVAGRCMHPHLLRAGPCGPGWLAMELLVPLALPITLAAFRQLLLALAHLHADGVAHGDVKPANLLADAGGALKLADFGLARYVDMGRNTGSTVPAAHGTPAYMAPELLRGQGASPRSDVFGAGVVLYELLSGTRLYTGTAFEVMQAILAVTAPPLGTAFDDLLASALQRDPGQRPRDGADFLSAFEQVCQSI